MNNLYKNISYWFLCVTFYVYVLKAPACAALTMKVFIVFLSSSAKAAVCIIVVMWFKANLRQHSSNS